MVSLYQKSRFAFIIVLRLRATFLRDFRIQNSVNSANVFVIHKIVRGMNFVERRSYIPRVCK